MRSVLFNEQARFDFAVALTVPLGAVVDPARLTVEASDSLAALIERLALGDPTVLPVREEGGDTWLVMGAIRRDLEATLSTIGHFVIPTYAEHVGGAPSHQAFEPAEGEIGRLGALIYPAGRYRLCSPSRYFDRMLERLGRWATLEGRRPQLQVARSPSYRELYDSFSAALSAGAWDSAAAALAGIRRRGLASADNLAFLGVQLLAQQRRWADLWRREDYADIARLRAPRAVRAALLAAFHQSELLPLEQAGRWAEALDTFRRQRGRLGGLLEGVVDTSYGPALRAYAYREASSGDRATLEQLAARAPDDETRLAIEALADLLPPLAVDRPTTVPPAPALTPQQALRLALADGDYGAAWAAAETLEDPAEQARAMLEVAYLSDDLTHAEAALLQLWSLAQPEQEALLQSRRLAQIVFALVEAVSPAAPDAVLSGGLLTDWLSWLAAAAADADDPRLSQSLPVVVTADDRYWNAARVANLAERLTDLVAGGNSLSRSYLREAVRRLRDYFLQEPEFPRDDAAYADVYEALYLATLEQREVNEAVSLALLRLAEARLRRTPAAREHVAAHLRGWLGDPVPALETVALETLDLLAAYGAQGAAQGQWYRGWAETLLASPRPLDRLRLESWLLFGEWIQPGADVLDALRTRLETLGARESDPVATLPSGFKVGIFTLSPDRAARVGDLLRRRNPGVEVVICDDKVLTDRARSLAQSADMVVVVTGCVKHALTYGIGPYLRDPVYPESVGSTSILQAIEARARSLGLG